MEKKRGKNNHNNKSQKAFDTHTQNCAILSVLCSTISWCSNMCACVGYAFCWRNLYADNTTFTVFQFCALALLGLLMVLAPTRWQFRTLNKSLLKSFHREWNIIRNNVWFNIICGFCGTMSFGPSANVWCNAHHRLEQIQNNKKKNENDEWQVIGIHLRTYFQIETNDFRWNVCSCSCNCCCF